MPDTQISEEMCLRAADAMERAACPNREGPFGLYDHSSHGVNYPYRVQDFRENSTGEVVYRSDNRDEAKAECDRLTRTHIARAALEAALSGHVVVPREPTQAQHIAAMEFALEHMAEYGVTGLSPFRDYPPLRETTAGMYRAMIQAAPGVTGHVVGWRTMDDAPKDGTAVLVWFRGAIHVAEYVAVWAPENKHWCVRDPATDMEPTSNTVRQIEPPTLEGKPYPGMWLGPTHWQPLPAPPVTEMEG